MSEPKLISPMLDNFAMGGPISEHDGVCCYPAMENNTNGKYIVKIISIPASQTQLDALLLTGAYSSKDTALSYFKELADNVVEEANTLEKLSNLEGFVPFESCQCVPMEDSCGYDIYLLSTYKRTLAKQFIRQPLTQLQAVNMGLDLCEALAVARRSGYLYIALKPNNVYVTDTGKFRIGDLGFVKLDSLKYASLPEQYRSKYIAPEIKDAFSTLNTTIDIYALGLILYQAYNNGALPFDSENAPEETFQPPAYADYELSEIILKACAPNPADRWQDPIEMGQALISYMQRNGVNDKPIIPPAVPEQEEGVSSEGTAEAESNITDSDSAENLENSSNPDSPQTNQNTSEENSDTSSASAESDQSLDSCGMSVDTSENSADDVGPDAEKTDPSDEIITNNGLDELDSDEEAAGIGYDEVSDEVGDILSQVDELVSHPVPEPPVAPEPVEVTLPEPEEPEETEDQNPENDSSELDGNSNNSDTDEKADDSSQEDSEEDAGAPKPKRHWLRNSLIVLAVLAVIAGGLYFYRFYYLLPINEMKVEGSEDKLTVYVTSDIDEALLSVECSDTYGTKLTAKVQNGIAEFTGLVPDTGYSVNVVVDGFHKLTGATSSAYSTPVQTNIVQCTAVTGSEAGSVILSFTVEGPDSPQWNVTYSSEGEEAQTVTFPSHMVTLNGLTVGNEYTFQISPEDDLYVTGTDTVTYTASDLVYAENLAITSNEDGKLTAEWTAPDGSNVENWTVRCYNTEIYNETQIVSDTSATFENLDSAQSYTVEVTAAGMSVAQRAYVSENAITFHDVETVLTPDGDLVITWAADNQMPEDGWVINYTVDGSAQQSLTCTENKAVISPAVPGAVYSFSVQGADDGSVLGFPTEYKMPEVTPFTVTYEDLTISGEDISFKMCKRPSRKNWNRYNVSDSDYRDTFEAGQKAAFVAKIHGRYGESKDNYVNVFVIRKEDGTFVSADSFSMTWEDMWHRGYSEMNIPSMPTESGNYTISVYFNGSLANEQSFAIK